MKWGLVLSGGGALGLANVGILEVLERENLRPNSVAASSMGAIIGALYCVGIKPSEMEDLCIRWSLRDFLHHYPWPFRRFQKALFRFTFRKKMLHLLHQTRIRDCTTQFLCIAGRQKKQIQWSNMLRKGFAEEATRNLEPYVFPPDTRMLDAIMASSAIPPFFHPIRIGIDMFVDLCNFAGAPAHIMRTRLHPDIVIATDTAPRYGLLTRMLPPSWSKILNASEDLLKLNAKAADLIILPDMPASTWRFDKAEAFIEAGRKAAEKALPEIKRLIKTL
ncbi:MAG TPA: patatin-like phospholipase family protein [Candidatus Peribacteraceae bacterium]|nr:patatin-like phospholipase family protein [Candidatus Peribacteraceae bacterium]